MRSTSNMTELDMSDQLSLFRKRLILEIIDACNKLRTEAKSNESQFYNFIGNTFPAKCIAFLESSEAVKLQTPQEIFSALNDLKPGYSGTFHANEPSEVEMKAGYKLVNAITNFSHAKSVDDYIYKPFPMSQKEIEFATTHGINIDPEQDVALHRLNKFRPLESQIHATLMETKAKAKEAIQPTLEAAQNVLTVMKKKLHLLGTRTFPVETNFATFSSTMNDASSDQLITAIKLIQEYLSKRAAILDGSLKEEDLTSLRATLSQSLQPCGLIGVCLNDELIIDKTGKKVEIEILQAIVTYSKYVTYAKDWIAASTKFEASMTAQATLSASSTSSASSSTSTSQTTPTSSVSGTSTTSTSQQPQPSSLQSYTPSAPPSDAPPDLPKTSSSKVTPPQRPVKQPPQYTSSNSSTTISSSSSSATLKQKTPPPYPTVPTPPLQELAQLQADNEALTAELTDLNKQVEQATLAYTNVEELKDKKYEKVIKNAKENKENIVAKRDAIQAALDQNIRAIQDKQQEIASLSGSTPSQPSSTPPSLSNTQAPQTLFTGSSGGKPTPPPRPSKPPKQETGKKPPSPSGNQGGN